MKFAFFDTKPYDKPSFLKYGKEKGIDFKFYEAKLCEDITLIAGIVQINIFNRGGTFNLIDFHTICIIFKNIYAAEVVVITE